MAWQVFSTLAAGNQALALFDTLSGQIAINVIAKCGASGTNAIVLTTDATNGPTISALVTGQHVSFLAAATSTAAVTINLSTFGALKAFAQDGTTQLGSGDVVSGCEYVFGYNLALDGGAGGWQLVNSPAPGSVNGGYLNIPQNSQTAAYTTVIGDSGKHILHPASDNNPRTFTIDSNANVPYRVGTAITFVNMINTVTIAITADTMTLLPSGSTGSRVLAANGIATALKIAATSWVISGTNLT